MKEVAMRSGGKGVQANWGSHGESEGDWETLDEFSFPSEPGMERPAADRVAVIANRLGLPASRVAQLHTAVAETVLNAMEHGNQYQPGRSVLIRVLSSAEALAVRVADQGEGGAESGREIPDLDAKLAGRQPARGWGFFLIEHMVDEVRTLDAEGPHTVELFVYLEGKENPHQHE
jgi:anti-sigma regulatory factor (Ser/Thr protein kinase)